MAAGDFPNWTDNERWLWFRAAENFYEFALLRGVSDIEAPRNNESIRDLLYKMALYSAKIIG